MQNELTYTYPPLRGNIRTSALIIGGGIRGLLTGYLLSKNGVDAILIEKNLIASGRTRYLPGFFDKGSNADDAAAYSDIIRIDKLIHKTPNAAPLKQIIVTNNLPPTAPAHTTLLKNALLPGNKIWRTNGMFSDKNAAVLDPIVFCKRIAAYISLYGISIYENTKAIHITENHVKTDRGEIFADRIIDCTTPPNVAVRSLVMEFNRPDNCDISVINKKNSGYVIYPHKDTLYCIGHPSRQKKYANILSIVYGIQSPIPNKAYLVRTASRNPLPRIEAEVKKFVRLSID